MFFTLLLTQIIRKNLKYNSQGRTAERTGNIQVLRGPGQGCRDGACGIKAPAEARRMWAVGAAAPGTLSRQRLRHRGQDIILE